jgi:DNA-binding PadR family transcriptional regulator
VTILEITILGIVSEGPSHAYNIEKIIAERGIRDRTNIGFSTIYAVLNKMQANGFLTSSFESQKNLPGRRVYAITPKGQQRFYEEIVKALSQPQRLPSLFETGLAYSKSLRKEDLKEALGLYDAELGRQIQNKVHELTDLQNLSDQVKRALLTRPLALLQAERKWVRELMGLL